MVLALDFKNKFGFVDGSIKQAELGDPFFSSWKRCNSMVTSWILNSVPKEIADGLMYFSSASTMWKDLQYRFHQSNGPRIFQIRRQLVALQQGSLDVSAYYTKLIKFYGTNFAISSHYQIVLV